MNKRTLTAILALGTLAGCAGHDPADHVVYRNEPLVKQVENGMTAEQVLTVAGPPSTQVQREYISGTCNNYVLNNDGHEQTYYVSFNSSGRVDGKGFNTCEHMDDHQRRHGD